MKNRFLKFAAFVMLFFAFASICEAQTEIPSVPNQIDWSQPLSAIIPKVIDWVQWLAAILLIAIGYLSHKIPVLNKIPNVAWRVIAASVVLIVAFVAMGADAYKLIWPTLGSLGLYELVFKNVFGKSQK